MLKLYFDSLNLYVVLFSGTVCINRAEWLLCDKKNRKFYFELNIILFLAIMKLNVQTLRQVGYFFYYLVYYLRVFFVLSKS